MQKAFKWLAANNYNFEFHNYKESGISPDTLTTWLQHIPVDNLINTKSATYRALPETDRKNALTNTPDAIRVMLNNTSVIKRPLIDLGKGTYMLGWDEKVIAQISETISRDN